MAHTASGTLPEGVIEHDGMQWKPKRGATAAAEEFIAARTLFIELHRERRWNPWVVEDRGVELEHATEVMDQWARAEPGHRMLTQKQVEARMAKLDRERERARTKHEKARVARAAHYSQERADARLAMIEHQSRLEYELAEAASFRDGSRFPLMDPKRRQEEIAKLDESIEQRRREIERLAGLVGDPEEIFNEQGWLPSERRDLMLTHYTYEREAEAQYGDRPKRAQGTPQQDNHGAAAPRRSAGSLAIDCERDVQRVPDADRKARMGDAAIRRAVPGVAGMGDQA